MCIRDRVTGVRNEIQTDLKAIVDIVRQHTSIPCAIGFGISTPEQAREMAGLADGVIVGSAIIKFLEQYGSNAPEPVSYTHLDVYKRQALPDYTSSCLSDCRICH